MFHPVKNDKTNDPTYIYENSRRVYFPMKLTIHATPAMDFAYCRTKRKHFKPHLLVAPRERSMRKHHTHARLVNK